MSMKDEHDFEDAVRGALWGVALGDAYGMPVEMWTRERAAERFGWIDTLLPGPDDNEISHGRGAGETTDDTAFTKLMCTLIERDGDITPRALVDGVFDWLRKGGEKNDLVLGPSTRAALGAVKDGVPPSEAGKNGRTDGAPMRIIPVGAVWDWRRAENFISVVHRACMPTHNTNIAVSAAAAVAAAVSAATRTGNMDVSLKAAMDAARMGDSVGYRVDGADVALRIKDALSLSESAEKDAEVIDVLGEKIGTGLPAEEAVPCAIALYRFSGGDALHCARLAANLGGDTDTIGAMACGICGGLRGYGSLPTCEIDYIRKASGIDFDEDAKKLAALAQRCQG